MWFDRFDIVSAYYHFFVQYHEGLSSRKYERLCKILSYYSPSESEQHPENMTENAQTIFDELVKRELG